MEHIVLVLLNLIFILLIVFSLCGVKFFSNATLIALLTKRNIIRLMLVIYLLYSFYFWFFSSKSYLYMCAYMYALAMLCINQLALNFNPEVALFFNQNSKFEKKTQVKTNLSDFEKSLLNFYSSSEDFFFDFLHFLFRLISFFTIIMHWCYLPTTLSYSNGYFFLQAVAWFIPRMQSFYIDIYYIYVFIHLFRLILYLVVKFCCTDSIKGTDKLILLYVLLYLIFGIQWF